jgi:PHD/YefM family antitoxin component YafN of YafNO toxin-antitoxin module
MSPFAMTEYNAVGISALKRNPARVWALSNDVPVAVFRHNHVVGFLLTARSYNDMLEKRVNLQANQAELTQLLRTAAPGLLELLLETYPDREFSPFIPQWPILGNVGQNRRSARTGVVTGQRLAEASELAAEWMEMKREEAEAAAAAREAALPDGAGDGGRTGGKVADGAGDGGRTGGNGADGAGDGGRTGGNGADGAGLACPNCGHVASGEWAAR